MRQTMRRLWYVLRQRQFNADLAEEMAFHREMKRQELEQRGVDAAEVRTRTNRELGHSALAQDRARDVWLPPWLQDVAQDFRFALRVLRKDRAFTLSVTIVLGLGIGVANLQYVLIDATCLRGLPIPDVERVLFLGARDSAQRDVMLSYRDVDAIGTRLLGISQVSAFTSAAVAVGDEGRAPDRALATYISAPLFDLLHEQPTIGRDFRPDDDRPGAPAVVMVSAGVWRSRYAADPTLVGRPIRINGVPTTVIGVMRDRFRFPAVSDLWLPLTAMPGLTSERQTARMLNAVLRMPEGATLAAIRTQVSTEAEHLARLYPANSEGISLTTVSINDRYNGRLTDTVWLTFIGVGLIVLLIACANAANLLLIRAGRRRHELAVRASLGASRSRIARQLVVESTVLAALGGTLAAVVSMAGLQVINRIIPDNTLPYWMTYSMDARASAALCAICIGTVFLFGLGPAMHVGRTAVIGAIKTGGHAGTAVGRSRRWMTLLLSVETGLSVVMLVALVTGVRIARAAERDFVVVDPAHVLTTWMSLSGDRYRTPDSRRVFYREVEERVHSIPAAIPAFATALPLGGGAARPVSIEGRPLPPGHTPATIWTIAMSPRYFEALGVSLVRGRTFDERDGMTGHDNAIVNQRFASLFFPHGDAIGHRIRLGEATVPPDRAPPLTIVGIAPTIRQRGVRDPDPIVYLPLASTPPVSAALLLRGGADLVTSIPVIREVVRGLDPDLPLYRVMPLVQALDEAHWNGRVSNLLANSMVVVAMALALIGFYAVMSHAVAQRTREIGIRMALGATQSHVIGMVVRRAAIQLGWGIAVGIVTTFAFNRVVNLGGGGTSGSGVSWLTDPLMLGTVIGLMLTLAAAASIAPAWTASRVDPFVALREE